jgi:uncharacterized membrane protein
MRALTALYLGAGILLIALSLPLIQGRVPPNAWYGFRVPKTLNDPEVWYLANAYAGRLLLGVGVITLIAALAVRPLAADVGWYAAAVGLVVGIALAVAVVLSLLYLRRLP